MLKIWLPFATTSQNEQPHFPLFPLLFLTGSGAISLCCATAECETWHPEHPGMQESICEGAEKSCSEERAPSYSSLHWDILLTPWQETLPSSGQVMHCPAAIPTPQSCPSRQFSTGFTAGFTAKTAPLEAPPCWGPCATCMVPNPHPGQSALGQVLGEWNNFIGKAAALSPAYWNPVQILPRCSLSLPYFGS